jgi:20S proteasome alpha/beta subunit
LTKVLLKVHDLRGSKESHARGVQAMSIALGIRCVDGAVLAADRQMTKEGGLKYEEKKYFIGRVAGNIPLDYAFLYCGIPEVAKIFENKVGLALLGGVCNGNVFMPSMVVSDLEPIFKDKESKYIESLILFGAQNIQPFIVRTKGSRVVRGYVECIGVGDSSIIHYFADRLPNDLTVEQAKPICAYLVTLANKYIDGCGFGPDVIAADKTGRLEALTTEEINSYSSKFSQFDGKLTEGLTFK